MTLKNYYKKYDKQIDRLISSALKEDRVNNDVTTNLLLPGAKGNKKITAVLLCKQDCILAGMDIFKRVFKKLDPKAKFKGKYKDGVRLRNKTKVLQVTSSLKILLAGERTALNFLQRMSGIATLTNRFVSMLKYPGSKVLHTRKTTPNFRIFDFAAVKTGGGDFHRHDLSSSVMLKDNHLEASGNITSVLKEIRKHRINGRLGNRFEIEVKNFEEVSTVVKWGKPLVKVVMLDNFPPGKIKKAIAILKGNGFKIEISGGIKPQNFIKYQKKGVDYYSIGMLTHSYNSVDFSLEF
jgi:nicotinate-nucleotide pyrophosphorylase (carboxylating)